MTPALIKSVLLFFVLVHAIRMFMEERASLRPTELEETVTRRRRVFLLLAVALKTAAHFAPIGYYGFELIDCLVG